jgi:hypothetical protein
VVRDSRILAPHVARRPPRTVVGLTRDRQVRFDQVAVRGGQLASRSGQDWSDVVLACGGGPRLLKGGQVALTTHEEELGPRGNDITRVAGRTAIATGSDGRMLLVTGSGYRDNHSQGMKLEELAQGLLGRGAREAMNLDGGGSVSMAVLGRKISDGAGCRIAERPVATALLLYDDRPALQPERIALEANQKTLPADGQAQAEVVARVQTASGAPVPDGTPVWFEADGANVEPGSRTVNGEARAKVTSLHLPGQARVRARSGYAWATTEVSLQPGPLNRLVAHLGPQTLPALPALLSQLLPTPPPSVRLQVVEVLAEDGWHNALAGIPIRIALDGQEVACQPTEAEGGLRLQLELPIQACELQISAGELQPIRLPIEAANL